LRYYREGVFCAQEWLTDLFACCIFGPHLQVAALKDVHVGQVAAGYHHSMCLNLVGSQVYSWGREDYGQLGRGTAPEGSFTSTPTLVKFPALEYPKVYLFMDIACGDFTSMALTIDHNLYTWGYEGTTGHQGYANKDVSLPKKLDVDTILKEEAKKREDDIRNEAAKSLKKKDGDADSNESNESLKKEGTDWYESKVMVVHKIFSSGQHSALLVKRYANNIS
jgi:alpha-tubulin suppressor-like RCC1 family protein